MLKTFYTVNFRLYLCTIIIQTICNIKTSKINQQIVFDPHIILLETLIVVGWYYIP